MLIHEGQDRSLVHDRRLACALALVAGALNAAGFYVAGVFSANMTGNVSTLADRVALGDLVTGLFYLALLCAFVLGAALSTLVTSAGKHRRIGSVYALAILVEGLLLAGLGAADLRLGPGLRESVLVFGLSFLMGLQNAIVTRISGARVRTTHVSGMATDVGIEIGALLDIALRRGTAAEALPYRDRLGLHGATILSFCLGGVLGVMAYRAWGSGLLFGAAALLLSMSLPFLRRRPALAAPVEP